MIVCSLFGHKCVGTGRVVIVVMNVRELAEPGFQVAKISTFVRSGFGPKVGPAYDSCSEARGAVRTQAVAARYSCLLVVYYHSVPV